MSLVDHLIAFVICKENLLLLLLLVTALKMCHLNVGLSFHYRYWRYDKYFDDGDDDCYRIFVKTVAD